MGIRGLIPFFQRIEAFMGFLNIFKRYAVFIVISSSKRNEKKDLYLIIRKFV
jgi:hypothetical protein